MKYVALFLFMLPTLHAENTQTAPFLKDVHSFSLYSQISPHAIDLYCTSTLQKILSSRGTVIDIKMKKAPNQDFYTAISNPVFLKLSLDNWIVETQKNTFKVETHLVLECTNQPPEKNPSKWISEEVFDFSSDKQTLLNRSQQAVKTLIDRFLDTYHQTNPDNTSPLTFFIL